MLEHTETKSVSGLPGLSQLPIFKYFFSEHDTDVADNEIVFALVPHVVRRRDYSELSRKTLDVGNAASIHLRHAPALATEPVGQQSDASLPPAVPIGHATAALELEPSAISVTKGNTFVVDVLLTGAQNVSSVPLQISYDKKDLDLLNISNGDFLSQGDQLVALVHRDDPSSDSVEITACRPPGAEGVSGHGIVSTLTFRAQASGRFQLKITKAAVIDSNQHSNPASGSEITVSVN
jgi:general secretion pathway protein D